MGGMARSAGTETPGDIKLHAVNAVPRGWLKCNGAAVSRATYAALFDKIGTTFGAGNGATTFNVPDMRGEFPRGFDDGRGVDAGRVFGSAQGGAIESHTHVVTGYVGSDVGSEIAGGRNANNATPGTSTATGGTETRPRNVAVMFCIKI